MHGSVCRRQPHPSGTGRQRGRRRPRGLLTCTPSGSTSSGRRRSFATRRCPTRSRPTGQVRIVMAAAGVHLVDTSIRRGSSGGPFALPELPMTPGREMAGTVDAVGPGVDRSWLGRRVVAHLGAASGGYAEMAVAGVGRAPPVARGRDVRRRRGDGGHGPDGDGDRRRRRDRGRRRRARHGGRWWPRIVAPASGPPERRHDDRPRRRAGQAPHRRGAGRRPRRRLLVRRVAGRGAPLARDRPATAGARWRRRRHRPSRARPARVRRPAGDVRLLVRRADPAHRRRPVPDRGHGLRRGRRPDDGPAGRHVGPTPTGP